MNKTKDKKKLIFIGLVICVLLFIGAYGILTFGGTQEPSVGKASVEVPKLKETTPEFESRLEAVDALEKEEQTVPPSVYQEKYLDSAGYYDKQLSDTMKKRMIDSVYQLGASRYQKLQRFQNAYEVSVVRDTLSKRQVMSTKKAVKAMEVKMKAMALEQQLFFASNPEENVEQHIRNTDEELRVRVDGTQTVKQDYRLRMRLSKSAKVDGITLDKNTLLYGFVSFKPNRTILRIEHINGRAIQFEAYDLDDGSKGIYIENSFQEDVRKQVVGDVVDDINLAGVPQVSGIKQLFRRSNRQVKVTVMDNYQLILKLKQ